MQQRQAFMLKQDMALWTMQCLKNVASKQHGSLLNCVQQWMAPMKYKSTR